DLVEVAIDLDFLRRIELQPDESPLDVRLEIEADGLRVSKDLGRRLVEAHHQTALAAARAFDDVVEDHDALADTRHADHERRAAEKVPAVHDLVQTGNTGRDARRRIERPGRVAARFARRLDATIHFDAAIGDDPERVAPHLETVSTRLDDFDRSRCGA